MLGPQKEDPGMRTLAMLSIAALALVTVAGTAQASAVTKEDFVKVCPLDLPGTTATSTPTADGIAVTFETTVPSSVAELRSRITKLSELVNQAVSQPAGAERPAVL